MALIAASGLGKQYGAQTCFQDAAFTVSEGDRIGFVGANGTGKTSLLRILLGETEHDGSIIRKRDLRMAALEQTPTFPEGATAREALLAADPRLFELETALHRIHDRLAAGDSDPRLLDRLSALETEFDHRGGYDLEHKADRILEGVGYPAARGGERVELLSGGERTRIALARVLMLEPDLWLLDEPTNHLDLDGVLFLEEFLLQSRAAVIVISHDRRFLDRVTTETWEIDGARLYRYPASYSRARELREERLKSESREFEKQQVFIERQDAFIRRYKAGQRARQARGRQKRLERLERLDRPRDQVRVMSLNLNIGEPSGRKVTEVVDLSMAFGDRALFSDLSFEVERGETIGIVGPNGSGKTTLLRILRGLLDPTAGRVRWGHRVRVGVLEQHESFPDPATTPARYLHEFDRRRSDQEIRDLLAAMLFRGEDVEKTVSTLSGGEAKRLMLTRLLIEGNNVLLLDEPTNHLDLPSREALELALFSWEGTLIMVSHDRHFLDQMADRIFWFEEGRWWESIGGFAEALDVRRTRRPQEVPAPAPKPSPPVPRTEKRKSPHARLSTAELEERIMACEARRETLNGRYADPAVFRDPEELKRVRAEIDGIRGELEALEEEYLRRDR